MEDEQRADMDENAKLDYNLWPGWGKEYGVFLDGELIAVQDASRLALYKANEGTFSDY